jgi:lipopolysaccharide export system permease protein
LRQSYDLSPDLLGLSVVRENLLDTPELQRYIRYLRSNNLDAQRYLIAYWSRMANIASVVLMTVLALPFVFGSLRSAGTGARMIVGLIIGLAYYVSVQVLAQGGQVFDLDPAVVAWTPSIALLLITTIALLRIR